MKQDKLQGEISVLAPNVWKGMAGDSRLDVIDSMVSQRHPIAHGRWNDSTVTMVQVEQYRDAVDFVLEELAKVLVGP
ncbi:hypothetical protein [Salsipaludibacter albus]|uniref:hypothetical protein n=1 Tax=Salsipaludibacter albus TaxID=2849650 RepID=UPI001EE476F9|nr:hypothetical protein [Salsipaludibacter albus]MBY5163446.1 hypothetical protein [Salsipaludibacter albus]